MNVSWSKYVALYFDLTEMSINQFDIVCTVQPPRCTKILVIRLYFLLDAVHVSDCISPSSGATFISCTSHLAYVGTIRLAVVWL